MHRSLPLVGLAAAVLLLAPAGARAAEPYKCDSSALRVTLPGAPPVEPITANQGAAQCSDQSAGGALPATPLPLTGGALFATTTLAGSDPLTQTATARAGVASLTVSLPAGLPPLPAPIPDFSTLPGGGVISVPNIGTVDLRPALEALVQPAGTALDAEGISATVTGQCAGGSPALAGDSSVGSLSMFGVKLSTTEPTERTLNVIDSQSIDPSKIDISKVIAPTADLSALQAALQPVLDALPDISIPAVAAQVKVTPGAETHSGDVLTRDALAATVTIAGMQVVDAALGEATVDATGVDCGAVAAAALGIGKGCTARKLTLIDVVQQGDRVKLFGAADPRRFAGRTVSIVSAWNNKTVARLKVAKSGLFQTKLGLPPASLRHGNRARYQARIGVERSLDLKLDRRMTVGSVGKSGTRKIVISGRVARPLADPRRVITVTRQVSCGHQTHVATVKPDALGRFKVTLAAPRSDRVYTFRFHTRVLYSATYPTLYDTYTLPQYVVGA